MTAPSNPHTVPGPDPSSIGVFNHEAIRAAMPGLLLAVSSILFGFLLGIVFGLNEDIIKDRLAAKAARVVATVYHGDSTAAEPVLAKSWDYMQRGHLHGGAIGNAALGLILVLLLARTRPVLLKILGIALGGGALAYSVYWVWAGFLAPGLGGTGAAKESLRWLAMPSSGAVVLGTVVVLYIVARKALGGRG